MAEARFRRSFWIWANKNRGRYDGGGVHYPSDLTDEEWGIISPLIPPAKRGGKKRTVVVREVVNKLMYILGTGCQWAALPKDLPPRSTVNDYFRCWSHDGTLDRIHHARYGRCWKVAGRNDSQSVKSADKWGGLIDPPGFDAGNKIKGKKRHILFDTQGFLMQAIVHSVGIQDRDGGIPLLGSPLGRFPSLLKLTDDSGYQGGLKKVCRKSNVEIVKCTVVGKFIVLFKLWVVERTIRWLNRCRRLAKK